MTLKFPFEINWPLIAVQRMPNQNFFNGPILLVDLWPSRPFVFLMSNLRRIFLIFFPEFFLSCLVTFIGLQVGLGICNLCSRSIANWPLYQWLLFAFSSIYSRLSPKPRTSELCNINIEHIWYISSKLFPGF